MGLQWGPNENSGRGSYDHFLRVKLRSWAREIKLGKRAAVLMLKSMIDKAQDVWAGLPRNLNATYHQRTSSVARMHPVVGKVGYQQGFTSGPSRRAANHFGSKPSR
jgi:hypothetical protein